MPKKIENEQDIAADKENGDIEIEFVNERKPQKSKKPHPQPGRKGSGEKSQKALLELQQEIEKLRKENERLQEEYLRLAADKENLRKRLDREKEDFLRYALSDLLKEMLDILDNFERALQSEIQESREGLREGVELIYKQYTELLKRQGVRPLEIEDLTFDPRVQQAFMSEESEEVDEPTVQEELQKGYMLFDRLLRPALVKVLVPKKKTGDEPS